MAVTETTDTFLFLQLAENDRVILKYYTNDCGEACMKFRLVYKELSEEPDYKDIVFLMINADNNPMAKKRVLDKSQPVITIYLKGKLLDSRYAATKEEVKILLEELLTKNINADTENIINSNKNKP